MGNSGLLTLVLLPLINTLEIVDTSVVEVLAREDDAVDIARVSICDGVGVGVPSTVALRKFQVSIVCTTNLVLERLTSIETTHESKLSVHHAELLVVGPEEHHIVTSSVQSLERILGQLGQAKSAV